MGKEKEREQAPKPPSCNALDTIHALLAKVEQLEKLIQNHSAHLDMAFRQFTNAFTTYQR